MVPALLVIVARFRKIDPIGALTLVGAAAYIILFVTGAVLLARGLVS